MAGVRHSTGSTRDGRVAGRDQACTHMHMRSALASHIMRACKTAEPPRPHEDRPWLCRPCMTPLKSLRGFLTGSGPTWRRPETG